MERIEAPTEDQILALVSVEKLRAQKRIVTARENGLIKDCILDAWDYIDGPEGAVRRAVLPQKWRETLYRWPGYICRLPLHGARKVTKVSAVIAGGDPVDLATSTFRTLPCLDGIDADLYLQPGTVLGSMVDGRDSMVIEFEAGWPDPEMVPRVFRRALVLIAAHFYDNREETMHDNRVTTVSRRIELGAVKLLEKQIVPLDYGTSRRRR